MRNCSFLTVNKYSSTTEYLWKCNVFRSKHNEFFWSENLNLTITSSLRVRVRVSLRQCYDWPEKVRHSEKLECQDELFKALFLSKRTNWAWHRLSIIFAHRKMRTNSRCHASKNANLAGLQVHNMPWGPEPHHSTALYRCIKLSRRVFHNSLPLQRLSSPCIPQGPNWYRLLFINESYGTTWTEGFHFHFHL